MALPSPPVLHRLSHPQLRIHHTESQYPGTSLANVTHLVRLTDPAHDPAALRSALQAVYDGHDALRLRLSPPDAPGQDPWQYVAALHPLEISEHVLSGEAEALAWSRERAQVPFERFHAPLVEFHLLRWADGLGYVARFHHIVCDGWTCDAVFTEVLALYRARRHTVASPHPSYLAYLDDERRYLASDDFERDRRHWLGRLADAPESALEHLGKPLAVSIASDSFIFDVPPALRARMDEYCRTHAKCTPYQLILAACAIVMSRMAATDRVRLAIASHNRAPGRQRETAGMFVATLPMVVKVAADAAFTDFVHDLHTEMVSSLKHHARYPLDVLARDLHLSRGARLYDLVVVGHSGRIEDGMEVRLCPPPEEATALCLHVYPDGSGWTGALEILASYHREVFSRAEVDALLAAMACVLESALAAPTARIDALRLTDGAARARLLEVSAGPRSPYPSQTDLATLFEMRAAASPHAVAVLCEDSSVTYGALNRRANALAHRLRDLGIHGDARVGLCVEPSVDRLVALLGILKAGGAYVALDARYPDERLRWMVEDAQLSGIVVPPDVTHRFSHLTSVPLIEVTHPRGGGNPRNPGRSTGPDDLAYVAYTSGSTGRPKGVAVTHRNVVRLVCGADYARLDAAETFIHLAPLTFDPSTLEIWGALLNGGRLALAPDATLSLGAIADCLRRHEVTTLVLSSALFQVMVDEQPAAFAALRQVITGGEAASVSHVRAAARLMADGSVFNAYGPTENATITTCHRVEREAPVGTSIPIGLPIANTTAYVLDGELELCPDGMPGELFAGGDGVARGYWGQPDRTAERFVPDPFSARGGARLYRTGDRVRRLPDGTLEFLGRLDEQVKIRGFRIEPGEIEAALLRHEAVAGAAVVARDTASGRLLAAYVVPRNGDVSARDIKTFLADSLPPHMVPSTLMLMDSLPLTAHGKVDRRALPAPPAVDADTARPPRTPVEEALVAMWQEVLGRVEVGVRDDFFELGGHSLSATQVISRIAQLYAVDLPLQAMFDDATVERLAERLERALNGEGRPAGPPIAPVSRVPEGMPLSFAQERLWFLSQLTPDSPQYNIPLSLRLEGTLDAPALERALGAVVQRHETLRTRFVSRDGVPLQVVDEDAGPLLERVDLAAMDGAAREAELRRLGEAEALRPFDQSAEPPIRGLLVRLQPDEHMLLLTLHHIAADGWSMGVLVRELTNAYVRGSLPDLPVQYVDFAAWQRRLLAGARFDQMLAYWKERLRGAPPMLVLPTDHPRPPLPGFRAGTARLDLSAALSERVRALAADHGCSLFMCLQAAFALLMHRCSGQADLVIGSPVANRTRPELEDLVGFFVNTLALRTSFADDPSFAALLARTRATCLEAYAHQDLPFERLVMALNPARSPDVHPLVQVAFALQNAPVPEFDLPGLRVTWMETAASTVRLDLEVHVWENASGLRCVALYSADLFEAATVAGLLEQFARILEDVVATPQRRASEISRVSAVEPGAPAPLAPATTLHALFEARVREAPHACAIVFDGRHLSYAGLDRRAGRLAHRLRAAGVGPERRVGVFLERSIEAVVAIVGVLKAGGAFVPLDPTYPRERLAFMMADAGLTAVVTRAGLASALPIECPVIAVDALDAPHDAPLPEAAMPGNVAYVIYTSGSTGQPKGAELTHAGACNLARVVGRALSVGRATRFLQFASLSFDASVWEIFVTLCNGATLVLGSGDELTAGGPLTSFVRRQQVTHATLPPALLAMLEPGSLDGLACLVSAGEAPAPGVLARYASVPLVVNAYGPTEATVCATMQRDAARSQQTPPIGHALANVTAYVLDERLAPVSAMQPGELYVGGDGVGRGYHGRPALTAERFVPDPFAAVPGARMYRTGDGVRRLPDGTLEFLGRLDDQVKIRGFRIEPGEIEAALAAHEMVAAAAVVTRETPTGPELAAYAVADRRSAALRAEMADWHRARVDDWKRLYDANPPPEGGAEDDYSGWLSSYTGEPILVVEMEAWLAATMDAIGAAMPCARPRVLEIGCGAGLVLARLAPLSSDYHATDFSHVALQRARRLVARWPDLAHVVLEHRVAGDFTGLVKGQFDLVVLNSVVQYFPSLGAFEAVVEGAMALLAPGGRIFLGDLRNLELLEALHASVVLYKAPDKASSDELRRRVRRGVEQEEELLLSPALFHAWRARCPRLARVEVRPKRGRHDNELTVFRYDAILHLDDGPPEIEISWLDGAEHTKGLAILLTGERPERLGLRRVPNARTAGHVRAAQRLASAVVDLESEGFHPETVAEVAAAAGYAVTLSWAAAWSDGAYDAVLRRHDIADVVVAMPPPASRARFANDPLFGVLRAKLGPRLKTWLADRLPPYMVPSAVVVLDDLPLTPNGKLDRTALLAHEGGPAGERLAPRTSTELGIAAVWGEVLGVEEMGVHDSFFDLGGHSLSATQVISRVNRRFGVDLSVRALFDCPTIERLAARVDSLHAIRGDGLPPIVPRESEYEAPLSFAQAFYFRRPTAGVFAHMAIPLRLVGTLDLAALEAALHAIARRHEPLRTRFVSRPGGVVQIIDGAPQLSLARVDLSALPEAEHDDAVRRAGDDEALRAFDLSADHPLRATLVRLAAETHILLLTVHHIACDNWSMGVLMRELGACYAAHARGDEGCGLPALRVTYADYARWQHERLRGPLLDREVDYWTRALRGMAPMLRLPYLRPRAEVHSYLAGAGFMEAPRPLVERLQALAAESGTSLFMVLRAALAVVVHRYTGQDDFAILSPVAGRVQPELEDLIGLFVNAVPIRTDVSADPTFRDLLDQTRVTCLDAWAHQLLPISDLVERLGVGALETHVVLALQNAPFSLSVPGLQVSWQKGAPGTMRFLGQRVGWDEGGQPCGRPDLELHAYEFTWEETATLGCLAIYNADLFEAGVIEALLADFQRVMHLATGDPDRRVSDLAADLAGPASTSPIRGEAHV